MVLDLVNLTLEDIKKSAEKSVESDNTVVVYLQNNGNRTQRLRNEDIDVWLDEDIDS